VPPLPSDEEVLEAIVALADDGFAPRRDLILSFRKVGEREGRRALGRSARRGLILERRDAEGRGFIAVSSEGWDLLRRGPDPAVARPRSRRAGSGQ
jgi:hypothetical protein